jgi:Tol biopolymer transport system component
LRKKLAALVVAALAVVLLAAVPDVAATPSSTIRVSVASDGTQADRQNFSSAISADGRFVAFDSFATNLVADDVGNSSDVFIHDRLTGVTEIVSVDSNGSPGSGSPFVPNGSQEMSVSADGRIVAFTSYHTNLVPNDTNGHLDVFVAIEQSASPQG